MLLFIFLWLNKFWFITRVFCGYDIVYKVNLRNLLVIFAHLMVKLTWLRRSIYVFGDFNNRDVQFVKVFLTFCQNLSLIRLGIRILWQFFEQFRKILKKLLLESRINFSHTQNLFLNLSDSYVWETKFRVLSSLVFVLLGFLLRQRWFSLKFSRQKRQKIQFMEITFLLSP